jgi:hypothetical protein
MKTIERKGQKRLFMYISEGMHKELRAISKERSITISEYVRNCIIERLLIEKKYKG